MPDPASKDRPSRSAARRPRLASALTRAAAPAFGSAVVAVALLASLPGCGTRPGSGLPALGGPAAGEVCQGNCTPDRGSGPYDCTSAESDGIEFLDQVVNKNGEFSPSVPMLWDFEGMNAPSMYSYTDKTTYIQTFVLGGSRKTWEPPAYPIPGGGRCGSQWALHVQGGPFMGWGGGIGMSMLQWPGNNSASYCSKSTDSILKGMTIDVSAWEGISFWARRGPNSQIGFRVAVGDKATDDDISYKQYMADSTKPRYCERVRECGCLDHRQCLVLPESARPRIPAICSGNHATEQFPYFCGGQPAVEEAAGQVSSTGSGVQCNTCNTSRCNDPYPAFPEDMVDAQYNQRSCTQRTFRNGISSFFCWNAPDPASGIAGDPPPAEPDQQCGDHWNRPVALTNDWRLYLVPFDSMLQQGFAKRSNKLDLTALSLVRFTWDGGWIDYWLDDVRFYRHKSGGAAGGAGGGTGAGGSAAAD
jgi:hypothetical protein